MKYYTLISALLLFNYSPIIAKVPATLTELKTLPFSNQSLKGIYAYQNHQGDVVSFGTWIFDGKGGAKINIKISHITSENKRTIATATASGKYQVNADGQGIVKVKLNIKDATDYGQKYDQSIYHFVISKTKLNDSGKLVATEVFSLLDKSGLNNQIVTPKWYQISPYD